MNREIKFRGWFKTAQKMIDLKKITPLAVDANLNRDGLFLPFYEDVVLMQFTGLKDKNGVEIYEGDIVQYTYRPGSFVEEVYHVIAVAEFRDAMFGFQEHGWFINANRPCTNWKPEEQRTFKRGRSIAHGPLFVIGNVYENPDLLKKENLIVKEQGEATGIQESAEGRSLPADAVTDVCKQ